MADATIPALFPVVAAALIDADGRVLVQRRPAGKALAGLWEFPGGKIEPGETPEQALARELDEELGIAVGATAMTPLTFASEALGGRHLVLLLFRVERWAGIPVARAADALAWHHPVDLVALPMPAADRPLAAMLARRSGEAGA